MAGHCIFAMLKEVEQQGKAYDQCFMNKVYNSQQLNKKSGACQKLTELTGFTHMKHVLITDTKTGVSGVTSNAQLFDDHIFIAMLATKEKGKCRKTF